VNLRVIPVARLVEAASIYCFTPEQDIKGRSRMSHYAHIRFAIVHVALRQGWSTTQTGVALGGRDHSTIIHARERANYIIARDPDFVDLIAFLEDCAKAWAEYGDLSSITSKARPNLPPLALAGETATSKFKPKPVRARKPKNRVPRDDRDAHKRRAGSLRLFEALQREFPERCLA